MASQKRNIRELRREAIHLELSVRNLIQKHLGLKPSQVFHTTYGFCDLQFLYRGKLYLVEVKKVENGRGCIQVGKEACRVMAFLSKYKSVVPVLVFVRNGNFTVIWGSSFLKNILYRYSTHSKRWGYAYIKRLLVSAWDFERWLEWLKK